MLSADPDINQLLFHYDQDTGDYCQQRQSGQVQYCDFSWTQTGSNIKYYYLVDMNTAFYTLLFRGAYSKYLAMIWVCNY